MHVVKEQSCLFCSLPQKRSERIIYENEHCYVVENAAPKAPISLLFIPKVHVDNLSDAKSIFIAPRLMEIATIFAQSDPRFSNGFRMVVNSGDDAGQSQYHLHLHLLAGAKLVHYGAEGYPRLDDLHRLRLHDEQCQLESACSAGIA